MEIERVMKDIAGEVVTETTKVMIPTEAVVAKDREEVEAEALNIVNEHKKNTEDNVQDLEITHPMTNTEEIITEEDTDIQNLPDHALLLTLTINVIVIVTAIVNVNASANETDITEEEVNNTI